MSGRQETRSQSAGSGRGRFADLVVFDRLEAGPVVVEPRRVSAKYTVIRGDSSESTELVYRFEEDVFDETPESHNLAAAVPHRQ